MARIVVLGAAESGVGAALLAQQKGFEVFVSDMGSISDRYKAELSTAGIAFEEGKHSADLILNADEVVKSPGIPDTAPMVRAIREKGIPLISEIEFAGRYTKAKMLCITGSNGKTTTTTLLFEILRDAGYNVGLAGNIGYSLARQVTEGEKEYYVIELSSFQLDGMYRFKADVAILLNITPDHLDRYDFCLQNYVDSKMRILQNQTADDCFIYWTGDEHIGKELPKYAPQSTLLPFSDDASTENSLGYVENNAIHIRAPRTFTLPLSDFRLVGIHNRRNAMATAMAALAVGIPEESIRSTLLNFGGVEHRMQYVADVRGVRYINDSKATNVDACRCALESMDTPVVLIIGGKDKGNDYSDILPLVKEKCRALVFLGADNSTLHSAFDTSGLTIADTHSMADCVDACQNLAQEGDTVLLSPCCASFDLFRNMEDRGEQFTERVHELR